MKKILAIAVALGATIVSGSSFASTSATNAAQIVALLSSPGVKNYLRSLDRVVGAEHTLVGIKRADSQPRCLGTLTYYELTIYSRAVTPTASTKVCKTMARIGACGSEDELLKPGMAGEQPTLQCQ